MINQRLLNAKIAINKAHGNRTVDKASSIFKAPFISTGSIALDRALGGGIAIGKAHLFYGAESSGKTTTAYRAAGIAQHLCANCFRYVDGITYEGEGEEQVAVAHCDCYSAGIFKPVQHKDEKDPDFKKRLEELKENSYREFLVALFDLEGAWEDAWARKLGINPERIIYVRPDTAEESVDIYVDLMLTAEVSMFLMDSLAAMVPSEEVINSAQKQQQGLQARILGKWNRKVQVAMNSVLHEYGRYPTQIWINQQREKIGIAYGDNTAIPGGKSQLFFSAIRVKFWSSQWEKSTLDEDLIKDHQSEVATRVTINFNVEKNRLAAPKNKSSYVMVLDGDEKGTVDEQKYVIAMAYKLGFMRDEGEGAKKQWFLGDQVFSTKKAALECMMEANTYMKLRNLILDRLLGR